MNERKTEIVLFLTREYKSKAFGEIKFPNFFQNCRSKDGKDSNKY